MTKFKAAVGAMLVFLTSAPLLAQDARLDPLFESLAAAEEADAKVLEEKIEQEWSKSGSPAMDFLLRRAEAALQEENYKEAIHHLTALTDHAPGFAEGWHLMAVAHFQQERYGLAIDAIERTLAIEPRHFQAMAGLMFILEDRGLTAEALEVALMIEAIHPHYEDLDSFKKRLTADVEGSAL